LGDLAFLLEGAEASAGCTSGLERYIANLGVDVQAGGAAKEETGELADEAEPEGALVAFGVC